MEALNILVLDDNEEHRDSAARQLVGHNVTIVGTYSEASKLLGAKQWDALLTDLNLPADGGDVCRPLTVDAQQALEGQEMPVGSILAFQALQCGVKRVGVLTDANHHQSFSTCAVDWVGCDKNAIRFGDARLFVSSKMTSNFYREMKEAGIPIPQEREKPWVMVLRILCSETSD